MASYIVENFWSWQRSPSEGTNCLFISKDHALPESDPIYVIFMACSVLGHLKKKKMEKIMVWPILMYASSDVF